MLWRTYGDCANYLELNGHKGAILDLLWSRDSRVVFSASADAMLASWDVEAGVRVRRYVGHEDVVNAADLSRRASELIISGSDDGTIGVLTPTPRGRRRRFANTAALQIWDPRQKSPVDYLETSFPITAVAMSEAGNEVFSGGIDNEIKACAAPPNQQSTVLC